MKHEKNFRICKRCIMDTTAKDIQFDENGICNYCNEFLLRSGHILEKKSEERERERTSLVNEIKKRGTGKSYDCIVGVSGGVDSSWVLVQAVNLGLKPLAVHMDNGWNSELAQNNIYNLIQKLGVDLYTHVIDWTEYRALMQAFFEADVVDVELLYDNAMLAVNYKMAARHGVQFILGGTNQATEGMRMPPDWNWFKFDKRNIKAIGQKFSKQRLRTFPAMGTFDYIYYEFLKKIHWVSFLDYFDFNKAEALKILQNEFSYKPYPYKHYESIFTRFYQGYLLREKFGVDKRKVHFSTLVAANQLTREEALRGTEGIAYPSSNDLEDHKKYFLKKMNWSEDDLKRYLARVPKSHADYPTEKPLWNFLAKMRKKVSGAAENVSPS